MGNGDDRPKLLRRTERRQSLIAAAARAFVRGGYAATSLEDVAAEAGVSRVLIYRHFESKAQLYRAVLENFRDDLIQATRAPDELGPASLDALVQMAQARPDEFRMFFRQAGHEPQFREHADWLRAAMAETAQPYLRQMLRDDALRSWASELVPTIAIEAVITWLDAGRPQPEDAATTVSNMIGGVINAMPHGDRTPAD